MDDLEASDTGTADANAWDVADLRFVPDDVSDLLRAVTEVQAQDVGRSWAWRGQGSSLWGLSSSLYRRLVDFGPKGRLPTEKQMRAYERDLVIKAIDTGLSNSSSHLQRLAELQHHGAATRLLDVTRDPILALWFASEAAQHSEVDGTVFAIEVTNALRIDHLDSAGMEDWLDRLDEDQLAVFSPKRSDERIKAQRGQFVFTRLTGRETRDQSFGLPTREEVPLADLLRRRGEPVMPLPRLFRIDVPYCFKSVLLTLLSDSYSLDYERLYPDLTGFAKSHGVDQRFRYREGKLLDFGDQKVDPNDF